MWHSISVRNILIWQMRHAAVLGATQGIQDVVPTDNATLPAAIGLEG